eukprot:scaffold50322_cov62-Phaeocystis_antarctica.AAC.10
MESGFLTAPMHCVLSLDHLRETTFSPERVGRARRTSPPLDTDAKADVMPEAKADKAEVKAEVKMDSAWSEWQVLERTGPRSLRLAPTLLSG